MGSSQPKYASCHLSIEIRSAQAALVTARSSATGLNAVICLEDYLLFTYLSAFATGIVIVCLKKECSAERRIEEVYRVRQNVVNQVLMERYKFN